MDFFECAAGRRSIRRFTGEKVTERELQSILRAGTFAPSAGNMQAREFVLVRSRQSIDRVVETTDAGITSRGGVRTQQWIGGADVIIVICFDEKRMAARYGEKGRRIMTLLDCMAVAENMMLAVTALGLGSTCVIGFDAGQLKDALSIPREITPLLMLPVGRPAEQPGEVRRLDVKDLVRLEC